MKFEKEIADKLISAMSKVLETNIYTQEDINNIRNKVNNRACMIQCGCYYDANSPCTKKCEEVKFLDYVFNERRQQNDG